MNKIDHIKGSGKQVKRPPLSKQYLNSSAILNILSERYFKIVGKPLIDEDSHNCK
jgi:hypothetical protein